MIRIFCIYSIVAFNIWNIANIAAFSYKNQDKWGATYPACNGKQQSPINLIVPDLEEVRAATPLEFKNYDVKAREMTLQNNGHTVIIKARWDSKDERPNIFGGPLKGEYVFIETQIHWSTNDTNGSEHAIDGNRYAAEVQFVHIKKDYSTFIEAVKHQDGIVVLAHLLHKVRNKKTITPLTPLEKALPVITKVGAKTRLEKQSLRLFRPFLPQTYIRYDQGSLTVPPCLERVTYIIRHTTMPVTEMQLELLRNLTLSHGDKSSVRDLQELNGREVMLNTPIYSDRSNVRNRQEWNGRKVLLNTLINSHSG